MQDSSILVVALARFGSVNDNLPAKLPIRNDTAPYPALDIQSVDYVYLKTQKLPQIDLPIWLLQPQADPIGDLSGDLMVVNQPKLEQGTA